MNWITNPNDTLTIHRIGIRAVKLLLSYDLIDCEMDITACHLNDTPLKLQDLLKADDFNFAHDVAGINRHLNRTTGKLENYFLPRFAK